MNIDKGLLTGVINLLSKMNNKQNLIQTFFVIL